MKVSVRLFAAARQAAGRDRIELELAGGGTVGELRRRLAEELPEVAGLIGQAMFALEAEYVRDDDALSHCAELARILPVSGG
jgi:molybdopterin converting factor small subunit